ncbi:MAG: hypothetical protein IPP40_12615 [bacterium]|nr:hypothetical protein [bacterium]
MNTCSIRCCGKDGLRDRITAALIAAMLILGGVLFAQSSVIGQAADDNTQISQNIERPSTVIAAAL